MIVICRCLIAVRLKIRVAIIQVVVLELNVEEQFLGMVGVTLLNVVATGMILTFIAMRVDGLVIMI